MFKKIKSIDAESDAASSPLRLTPIIEDGPATGDAPAVSEKFPNFIHQGSHLNASAHHDVHQPSPLILPIAVAAAVIWIICVMAMYFGFFGNIGDAGGKLTVSQGVSLAMLALIPAIMIGVIAYALRQLSAMSSAANQLTRAARSFSQPDESVISKAKVMSHAVSKELDTVKTSFDSVIGRISTLEEVIRTERETLDASSLVVKERFENIGAMLLDQHKGLEGIATIFDDRMTGLSKMIENHKADLEAGTQLAEQKLHEARVSLDGALEKMDTASENIRSHSLDATTALSAGHKDIEMLGEKLQTRSVELKESQASHTAELAAIMADLRTEQDNLAVSLDDRLEKMRDMSLSAQVGAESLKSASDSGRETVEALADAARLTESAVKQRFTEMEDMVRYSNARAESISDLASRRVQDSLSQTRKEIARIEDDMMALQNRLEHPDGNLGLEAPEPRKRSKRPRIQIQPISEDETASMVESIAEPVESQPEMTFQGSPERPLENQSESSPESHQEPLPDETFTEDFSLDVQEPDIIEDLEIPDPDADITDFDTETLRRAAPEPELRRRRVRTRRGWRDILGGIDAQDEQEAPTVTPKPSGDVIVASLSELGLTPGAIVDDGCIIEACNARKSSGDLAMSQAVASRLGEPVRHLYIKMEENPEFKSNARAFTTQYKVGIEAIEEDREAIRIRLESDLGRAFLLCDAALYG